MDDSGNVVLPHDTGEILDPAIHGKDEQARLPEGGLGDGRPPTLENVEGGGNGPPLVNDPTRAAPVITDVTGIEGEQTGRPQVSDQTNGPPTGTIHENVNPHDTRVHKSDVETVQTDNLRQFGQKLNQEDDKGYEGDNYFPEGGYEDEVFEEDEYVDDDGMNINLLRS